jgi:CubicO group peptidase (beta-lactamase class C family)
MKIQHLMVATVFALTATSPSRAEPPTEILQSQTFPANPASYESYAGTYALRPGFIITLTHDGTRLFAHAPGRPATELLPSGEHEFVAKAEHVRVSFMRGPQGEITALVLHQGGRDMQAPRIVEKTAASLSPQLAAIEAMAAAEYAKHPQGSVTIGVVSGKELVWTKSFGYADMARQTLADQNTIYRIGSVTKLFTALMLEQLADAGTVRLSDPVEKYFPEVNAIQGRQPSASPMTLFQLATHTSGMAREPADIEKYLQGASTDWEKTLIAALKSTSINGEPGVQFSYSNIGYATLGAALARAAKTSYVEYLPKYIFSPLGMLHTWLDNDPAMGLHLSTGHAMNGGVPDTVVPQRELVTGRGYKMPNGAAFSTVGDLAKFASFLLGQGPDAVLRASALQKYQRQTAIAADFQFNGGYGLAGMTKRRAGYTAFGHEGSVAGWSASLELNGEQALGVIVLTNAGGDGGPEVEKLALDALDLLSK